MDLTGLKSDLTMLDTFAGIGGFSYAASKLVGNIKTTQFIEIDPFCQKILKKHFPNTPIHDDIRTFTARPFQYDVITGGFPCQDISVAGRREGITEESRSGLFYELMRVIRMVRPKFIVLENVAAILNNGLDIVLGELSEAGYDAEWSIISASSLGACHRRSRWWLVAYPNNDGQQGREFETRNQNVTGQNTQVKWSTNSENFKRQSNDGDDKRESRVDENLSRSSNGREAKSTDTRRICELSEGTDNDKRIVRENHNKENNNRALVSERQSGFSYPSVENWQEIKPYLKIIRFDKEMTTIQTKEWTPKTSMLPTPTARDYKGRCSTKWNEKYGPKVIPDVLTQTGDSMSVSPFFLEEVMGYPIGWTELKH